MDKHGFNLSTLLHDLVASDRQIRKWQDVEALVVELCRKQDPRAVHNVETDPDVLLSNGFGIEAKSTTSLTRGINLNSAAPNPKTVYAIVYYQKRKIRNVALVSGQFLYCPEIPEYEKINTSLQTLSNPHVRVRTRVMWQMMSPFEIWGRGNFVVDKTGTVHTF